MIRKGTRGEISGSTQTSWTVPSQQHQRGPDCSLPLVPFTIYSDHWCPDTLTCTHQYSQEGLFLLQRDPLYVTVWPNHTTNMFLALVVLCHTITQKRHQSNQSFLLGGQVDVGIGQLVWWAPVFDFCRLPSTQHTTHWLDGKICNQICVVFFRSTEAQSAQHQH